MDCRTFSSSSLKSTRDVKNYFKHCTIHTASAHQKNYYVRFKYLKFELTIEFFLFTCAVHLDDDEHNINPLLRENFFSFKYLWQLLSTAVSMKVDCRHFRIIRIKTFLCEKLSSSYSSGVIYAIKFLAFTFILIISNHD